MDNILPLHLIYQIYEDSNGEPAWGTYVTINEAESFAESTAVECNDDIGGRQSLIIAAISKIIQKASPRIQEDIDKYVHGAAVWTLASTLSNEVDYHIDYAELIRYEHNIIVPPLYGCVVHCTDNASIIGGDFMINTDGIDHYEKHGYKCKLASINFDCERSWTTIPYKFNRAILFNGEFPHLSTKLTRMPSDTKRVIIGVNFFTHDVGPIVQLAPEHSPAFVRRVKMHQALSTTFTGNGNANTGGYPFDKIRSNKALRKLFVLAKREKVKQQLREEQIRVTSFVIDSLRKRGPTGASVGTLMKEICNVYTDMRIDDVHVHLNRIFEERSRHGLSKCGHSETNILLSESSDDDNVFDELGMIL
eukprot:CAMPEP_0116034356 /NCGR_PEP_ID=MMETSP0321-20121206/19567_1 /TAXON_ID=163516 /ORGANISM="Leptocylindrus danicus var. danicus, Strain B650" /LENGTH=362 /DNA_ID=CAMNT_0003510669 /DNA_START=117 /DNA_END=1202 /DNA_ORIENTATION=+